MSASAQAGGPADRPGADQLLQRAGLLADLGRYEDAAAELAELIAAEPGHAPALTMLARVRLAAGQPAEAIAAADAAVAAAPRDLGALVTRGMVLADLGRLSDAASAAEQILQLGADSGYAQTSAAAILAEVRNGQQALDAAWRGVQLAPEDATPHLVLALVAARMGLFDLAERAYRESLRLDPQLDAVRDDVGIARLEQRRYARALEEFVARLEVHPLTADPAGTPSGPADPASGGDPAEGFPTGHAAGWQQARGGPPAGTRAASGWAGANFGLDALLRAGVGYALIAPLVAACVGTDARFWRGVALLLAVCGFVGLGLFRAQAPPQVGELVRAEPRLATAAAAVVAAPCLILLYALVGSPWPLVAAIAAGAVVLLAGIALQVR